MNENLSIYDILFDTYKITKPIRMIELFGGYGSQSLAMKYLGANYESYKLCEWAIKSIQAYKDIHFHEDNTDYSNGIYVDDLINYLSDLGISNNYNDPMTIKQIKQLKEDKIRTIYNNIKATHDLVNIQRVHGKDLEIVDKDKFEYVMTYSFPCQDLSMAGKRSGMDKGSGTRSGMLWEVERILDELKADNQLPQVLLMENVTQVHGMDNMDNFRYWMIKLEELGYSNYWQDMIATDYGIPQTRDRTFMISILGRYNYRFPSKIPLRLKLKDMLEDDVDEKYYLSNKQINEISNWNAYEKPLEHVGDDPMGTITTRSGAYCASMKLVDIPIKCATKKGYKTAAEGDGVDIGSLMKYHRGTVQKGKTQTLTTAGGENNGVVICEKNNDGNKNNVKGINTNVSEDWKKEPLDDMCRTILANKSNCGVACTYEENSNLRIRKLTPRECFRLMGVRDDDFDNVAKNQSNASLYHLAGDSIVVNVLIAIFGEML